MFPPLLRRLRMLRRIPLGFGRRVATVRLHSARRSVRPPRFLPVLTPRSRPGGDVLGQQRAEARRRHRLVRQELPVEVRQVVEARREADLGDPERLVVHQELAGEVDPEPVDVLHQRQAGVAAEAARESSRAPAGDLREVALAEGLGQVVVDVGERLVDPGRHEAGRVGQVRRARQRPDILRLRQRPEDAPEELDPADAPGLDELSEQRADPRGRPRAEEQAPPAQLHRGAKGRELGDQRHRVGEEALGELHDPAAERHRFTRRDVAHPVVRQVGAGQDQVAGLERRR